jgi:hypothetical protein
MVADPNLKEFTKAKFMRIESNRTLYNCIQAISGEGSGGEMRPFYNSEEALGDGSLTRPIKPDRALGSRHALSFEYLLNLRSESGLALTAGMVDVDGVALKIHPKQVSRCSYMDQDFNLKFPFSDGRTVYQYTDNTGSVLDATLPNKIGSLTKVGDAILEAYWITNKDADGVKAAEREVLEASPSLTSNTIELRHIKSQLSHCFGREMRKGEGSSSIIERRLRSTKMVDQDSFDVTPQERQAARNTASEETGPDRTVTMQWEILASKIDMVLRMINRAMKEKQRRARGDCKEVDAWFSRANHECMVWAFELFNHMYHDPNCKERVEPVAAEIWKSTLRLFAKIPEESNGNIIINRNDPGMRRGTANVAFAFNHYMKYKKLSPYGNWQRELVKIYGQIMGVYGRRNDIKQAIHETAIAPSNPRTMREVLIINGKMGMAKSLLLQRMAYMFNREYDPDHSVRCRWIQFAGGGSKCSKESGGVDFTSGGISFADEAVDFIAKKDEESKTKLNTVKGLITGKRASKPRTEMLVSDKGAREYRTVNFEFYSNTSLVYAHNLGPFSQYIGSDGLPHVPDDDRRAFLDRTYAIVVTETAGKNKTLEESAFHKAVKDNYQLMTIHSVVVRVTYMVKHVVSLVDAWRPSNEVAADAAWSAIDEWMKKEYDIPYPDDRRKTIRRDLALTRAIESAVVQVLVYKETAVSFDDMLPISEPFDESVPEDERVHILDPFCLAHFTNIVKLLHYDVEIVVSAASSLLDRCMYTMPDMHHIMVAFAQRHGIGHSMTGQTICSADPNRPIGQGDVASAAAPSPSPITSQPAAGPSSRSTPFSQFYQGGFDSGFAPFGSSFDPGNGFDGDEDENTTPVNAAPEALAASAVASPMLNPPPTAQAVAPGNATVIDYSVRPGRARIMADEVAIRNTLKAQGERRVAQHSLLMRSLENGGAFVPPSERNDPKHTVDATFKRIMFGSGRSNKKECMLINGKTMDFKRFVDLILPTSSEILDGGYVREDICRWTNGQPSQTNFTPSDGETMFLGVSQTNQQSFIAGGGGFNTTSMWSFKINKGEPQNSERRVDPSWRTPRNSYDASSLSSAPRDAAPSASGDAGAGGAGASGSRSSANKPTRQTWISGLFKESQQLSIHRLSKFHIEAQTVFDRIQQIAFSDDKKKRLLQVSSSEDANNWRSSHTLMRVMKDGFQDKYTGVDADKCIGMSDSVTPDTRQHIIPLHALGWRNALSDPKFAAHHQRESRDESTKLLDVVVDNIGQRRLDAIIVDRSLPAISPFLSTAVQEGSPIQIEDNVVFLNSAYALGHIRLDVEMSDYLSTIPGLRDFHGEIEVDSVDVAPPSTSPRSTEELVVLDTSGSSIGRNGGTRIPASVGQVVSEMVKEGRTEVTISDIELCISTAKYTRRRGSELYDKPSIYFTFNMLSLFNHEDDRGYNKLVSTYPSAFRTVAAFKSNIPHIITRFSEATDNAPEGAISASGAQALLTMPRFASLGAAPEPATAGTAGGSGRGETSSPAARPRKRRKKLHEFSMEKIEMIQRNQLEQGKPTDDDTVCKIANKEVEMEDINRTVMHNRRSFVNDLIMSKHENGILPGTKTKSFGGDAASICLFRLFQEAGTNASANLRRMVASKQIPATGDDFIDKRSRYLWPLPRITPRDGTCEEIEQKRIENCIRARMNVIKSTDGGEEEAEDEGDESDNESDDDGFDEITLM